MGFFINQGSRDETDEESGITHLIEHMLFKGTSQRSSLEIVKFIESLGGSFDAYTTKEGLIIITRFLSEHITRVFELIAEVLSESQIAETELKKERAVVLEEIKSNNENPDDYIFDLFFRGLFRDHSMGRPIAGSAESVHNIDTVKAQAYYRSLKRKKMIIAISGNFDYDEIIKITRARMAGTESDPRSREKPTPTKGGIIVQHRSEISQVHCVVGTSGVGYPTPQRYALSLLNTAFGGGMSSRLFQGLREKAGLVYDVQSFLDLYSDCGVSGFYFVCDKNNLLNIARHLKDIFQDINRQGFSDEEIELAKTYLSGNLLLSLESSTNRMMRLGKEMLYMDKVSTIDEAVDNIKKVTSSDINKLIGQYLDPKLYTASAIGPIEEKDIKNFINAVIP